MNTIPATLPALQTMLRQLDANGWLSLTDEEQADPVVLREAIALILSQP